MPQLLITARDYLVHRFKCCSDADLLRAATEDHHEFEATFNYNWWVRLDKSDFCPVDVYMQDEIWDLHQESSEKTVAYQKYGINITVARHYVRRGQPLEFPTLPPIVFKALEHVGVADAIKAHLSPFQKRVWYLPLEKLYLHPHRARHLYEKFEDLLGIMGR